MTYKINDLMVDVLLTDVELAGKGGKCGACTKCTKCTAKTGDPSDCTGSIQCDQCDTKSPTKAEQQRELDALRAQLHMAMASEEEQLVTV
jgi:hypothetical protein